MRSNFFKLFLLITFLFLSSSDLLAQYNWTRYPNNPIMSGSGAGTWDKHVFLPSVVFNSDLNRYEMWYNGSYGPEVSWRPYKVGFAWSPDGINWTKYSGNPVLAPDAGTWDEESVEMGNVIKDGGIYKMWYCGKANNTWQLGYATSPDGITWTKYAGNPVLSAGTDGWEAGGVLWCCVLPEAGGYTMYYTGTNTSETYYRIGRATSPDGINWQRDVAHNPVISVGSANQWDDRAACAPQCTFYNNKYYLVYTGWAANLYGNKIGLATSPDGITWTKYANNPALNLGASGSWDGNYVEGGTIMFVQDKFWMWYDGSRDDTAVNLWRIGLATAPVTDPLIAGTYIIGSGGDFPTIPSAFTKLKNDGINGAVTFELINDSYTAPADSFGFKLIGPIAGTGPTNRITIKPAADKNVTIKGSGMNVLYFSNTSYLTLDGVDISGSTSLTIHSLHSTQYQWKNGVFLRNNSDNNIIKYLTFIQDDYDLPTYGILTWTESGSATADNNQILYNFIKSSGVGICISGKDQATLAINNMVKGNTVGSENDSLITWGIYALWLQNSFIQDNVVQNMRFNFDYQNLQLALGINASACIGTTIRNNVVHNINSSGYRGSSGILLSSDGNGYAGNINQVYNNMVYNIQSSSTHFNGRIAGIQLYDQDNPKIYYNSVYLSGIGNNANPLGSAALYIFNTVFNADVRNNILVNTRDEAPYCATSIYSYSLYNFTSDYNDLFYSHGQNSCLVRAAGVDYHTLAEWQAKQKDMHSYDEMPHFVSSTDLHIDEGIATYLESRGTPIAGISFDFDWDSRKPLTPDIGADEFNGIVGVEDEGTIPTEFALEQNYPNPFNPSTTFRYSVPTQSKVVIKVFDVLGNEIATLMDEEKSVGTYELTWNAANLSSGIYFYQLKASDYVQTRKMILLK
jgi:predicted GH43/DUF377 family glycosyl hydrolase